MKKAQIIYVMGVSGCGKSTIGKSLADRLKLEFADGDDFHPPENVAKMESGQALNDLDRQDWLLAIRNYARSFNMKAGVVIACSALKEKYRSVLADCPKMQVEWVYLKGRIDLIQRRMEQRQDHFMPVELLRSQFDTLEEPTYGITIAIDQAIPSIVNEVCSQLK